MGARAAYLKMTSVSPFFEFVLLLVVPALW